MSVHPDSAFLRTWAASLDGEVVLPGDAAYDSDRRVWNLDVDRRPAAIVKCAHERDVIRALGLARDRDLIVAVRCGGHSQAGHSTCDDGILIDVSRLNRVEADVQRRVLHVGAGARVRGVLEATNAIGMATPTGGCPEVGIAGLTLGGGVSFLMARHGSVSDNVLSARVVTADGRLVTASAEEHDDLYWALRGGGGNFGIVTSFDFALHPLERVLYGRLLFPVSRATDVLRRYRDLMTDAPDELQTAGGIVASEQQPQVFIAVCHCGERRAAEALVERWRDRLEPASDDVAWTPYAADLALPAVAGDGTGHFLPVLSDAAIDALAAAFTSAPPFCTVAWNDFHGAVTRPAVEATAFPLRAPGADVFVHATWKEPEARRQALAWLAEIDGALRPLARGVYVNNIGEAEAPSRTADAYGANFARLRSIKTRYDPENIFRLNHNIPPG